MTRIAFIGSVGVPNRYGGFESFLDACAPFFARDHEVIVTCDAGRYDDHATEWHGIRREFIAIPANGPQSILHDIVAFVRVLVKSDAIVVLGVSAGIAFPLFRLACGLLGKRLIVNVDGVEWRRSKFTRARRAFLRLSDTLAQAFAHRVVVDSAALSPFLSTLGRRKAATIAYSGDQVARVPGVASDGSMLTICRIEPENHCEMLLEAAARSGRRRYRFVGNWNASEYGRALRARFADVATIEMLDPVYDHEVIADMRERCAIYLHGHSVGGTNPSLVEILFYDPAILAYDCSFNRETAGEGARYFSTADELAALLDRPDVAAGVRPSGLRERYTRALIVEQYLALIAPTDQP